MNNRTQQRFDRSIRDAVAHTQRLADLRHAEQQAYVEATDRARSPHALRAKPLPLMRLSAADQLSAYDAGVRHPLVGG